MRIIAIDGGAASGKSSTARALSEQFNLLHVDTGAHFRALTHELLRRGISARRPEEIVAALPKIRLSTRVAGRCAEMLIDGRAPGDEIRSPEVNREVSHFAALPEVRALLRDYQRSQPDEAARHGFQGIVMEGRDIGTVIFPQADLRFFLSADPGERARRRQGQGEQDTILERDRLDSQRKEAPLVQSEGAIAIDTTHHSLPEVVERLASLIQERFPELQRSVP